MADQFIGEVLAEKYRLDSLMREGALGNLYRGTHLLMEKQVCVKILPPTLAVDEALVNSFANEARTVSRISHPNILSVTDYGSDTDGTVFIVFEDAGGETLKDIIKRVGKLSLKRANRVIREIESALTIAHNNGIVHQNLSSENILVQQLADNSEVIKILNFGTAPFDINDLDYPSEKIEYLAPEQCTPAGEIETRTDVYALGIILYEMLAGEVPFTANNGTDLMLKQTQETPPPINLSQDDLPAEVDGILLRALAKNPEIRYQTVNEFAESLNQVSLLAKDGDEAETMFIPAVSTVLQTNAAITPEQPQNNLWKTAFIVLAGITLLGASFIYLTSGKQTNPTTRLQTDANGMPVQPVNPATGATEQGLANMNDFNPNFYSNTNTSTADGGGVSNPYWESGTYPPGVPRPVTSSGGYGPPMGGDPRYVPPSNSGPVVTMDPNDPSKSIFMQDGNTYVMVPKPSPSPSVSPTPKGKGGTPDANVSPTPPSNTTAKPSPTPPAANTATPPEANPTANPKGKPTKAAPKPKTTPKENTQPAKTERNSVSGKEQDTSKK